MQESCRVLKHEFNEVLGRWRLNTPILKINLNILLFHPQTKNPDDLD